MKRHRSRSLVALLGVAVAAVTLSACIQADQGTWWLRSHLISAGDLGGAPAAYVAYTGTTPDLGDTAQTALSLKATDRPVALALVLNYLEHHVTDYTVVPAVGSQPQYVDAGHTAMLLLVAHATGTETAFGASSLLSELRASQQGPGAHPGMFGTNDPTYDGVYRTSLALLALTAFGATTSDPAVADGLAWLRNQQCSDGGFSTSIVENPCSGLPANGQGPDTNSTALALEALAALGRPLGAGTPATRAIDWLAGLESSSGAWPYFPGNVPDSNSTALVYMGLRAFNLDLHGPQWLKPGGRWPATALLGYQYTVPGPNFGGFVYQAGSLPDPISTEQASLALSGVKLPF